MASTFPQRPLNVSSSSPECSLIVHPMCPKCFLNVVRGGTLAGTSSSMDVCNAQSVQNTDIAFFTRLPINSYCFNMPACQEGDPECSSSARSIDIRCPEGNVGVNPAIYR